MLDPCTGQQIDLKTCETTPFSMTQTISHPMRNLENPGGQNPTRANLKGVSAMTPPFEPVEDSLWRNAMETCLRSPMVDLMRIARHRNDPAYLAEKIAAKFNDVQKREEVKNRLMDMNNWYLPLKLK
jgi:hypothetical protein